MIAERLERKRGQYLAFNRDIAADAKRKFPRNVSCRTCQMTQSRPPPKTIL